MPRRTERLPLTGSTPGTTREVIVHRYGAPGARPKAYIQASLHADETPGLLVAHHLIRLLDEVEDDIRGEIVVVPFANPIGLAQFITTHQIGRDSLTGGGNFNRNWPDLFAPVAEKVAGVLGGEASDNVARIRAAMRDAIAEARPRDELEALRQILSGQAVDADLVFDLHCDDDALMHFFVIPQHWPLAADIAAELGCHAVLLAEDSGGTPFDEAFSTPWIRLAEKFPDHPIPATCLSATVELRGSPDVSDALAAADAGAFFRVLQRRGLISGDPGLVPEALCEATRLDACEIIKSPAPGVLSYTAELGARIERGDVIAWLIDPAAENPANGRQAIHAGTDGVVFSRRVHKFVLPGMTVAKIAGQETLPERLGQPLLED